MNATIENIVEILRDAIAKIIVWIGEIKALKLEELKLEDLFENS